MSLYLTQRICLAGVTSIHNCSWYITGSSNSSNTVEAVCNLDVMRICVFRKVDSTDPWQLLQCLQNHSAELTPICNAFVKTNITAVCQAFIQSCLQSVGDWASPKQILQCMQVNSGSALIPFICNEFMQNATATEFSGSVSGSGSGSVSCSTLACSQAQYFKPCSKFLDSTCLNCSTCAIGQYLVGCTSGTNQQCSNCTNKYEICGITNGSVSVYIGPGMLQSDCTWVCVSGYYRSGDMCRPCTASTCGTGTYRTACTSSDDGACAQCSGLPEYAIFVSAGTPYDVDNCNWTCNEGYYLNSSKCNACQQPSSCARGTYIVQCTKTENFKCAACAPVEKSDYIRQGSCDTRCVSGYFDNGTRYGTKYCAQCSQGVTCSGNQTLQNCTADHDARCIQCDIGKYETNSVCVACNATQCSVNGTYRGICNGATADSQCLTCTHGPLNSYYTSPGSLGMDDCLWLCNAGFERKFDSSQSANFCSPCPAGSYSLFGDLQCRSCSAGTYSGLTGATTAGTCEKCSQGKYSSTERAISMSVCVDCDVGTYQGSHGSSSCDPCPKDSYGTVQGATSQSQCTACRTIDTSTRQKVGQKFFTACICNLDYYRIDNKTDQCQKCPPGLTCNGYDYVVPVVNQSLWSVIKIGGIDFYRLHFCPRGYYYSDLHSLSVTDPGANAILASQQCTACTAGVECINPPCSSCSNCLPGTFKSCSGPTDCLECKADTFQAMNGSLVCEQCPDGTTTNGRTGSVGQNVCICDLSNYDLQIGEGCQLCPAGMQCFGNSTVIPVALYAGVPEWKITTDTDRKKKYNLTFCPGGYYIAGSIAHPGQMQCSLCLAGYECVDPPCYGACQQCKPGFWKSEKVLYPYFVPRSKFEPVSGQYSRLWVEEPCASCPINTYRQLEGGTEVGSCTTCPPKSTTGGLLNRTAAEDCRCDMFFYAQATSRTSSLTCADCPQGAVCASDRSCALGLLGPETFVFGNKQSSLSCPDSSDPVHGGWVRNGSGEYRLEYCLPGFTMQKSEFIATADKCIECPPTSYLQETVYSPSVVCRPCPIGATCPGGSQVIPNPGYWKMPDGRRDSRIVPKARVFQCDAGVCKSGGICINNRTGPVLSNVFCFCCFQCMC